MATKPKKPNKPKSAAPAASKSKAKAPSKPAAPKSTAQRAKTATAANKASKGAAKPAKPLKPAAKAKPAPAPKKKPAAKLELKPVAPKKPAAPAKPQPKAEKPAAKTPVAKAAAPAAAAAKGKFAPPTKHVTSPKAGERLMEMAKASMPAAEPRKEEKKPVIKPAYKAKEFVVYPSHGVGQIVEVVEQEVAGHKLELYVINFEKEKMTLRVPTNKAQAVGMRKLSDATIVGSAIDTLKGRARIKRTMWSRRAQEYEAKINSGDLISIAEVVRDLYRSERQPEQSYSERQLYEAALDRMAREVAVVERIGEDAAVQRVEAALQGGSGRGEKAAIVEEVKAEESSEEEAA